MYCQYYGVLPTTPRYVPPDSSHSSGSPPYSRLYIVYIFIRHFFASSIRLSVGIGQSHAQNHRDDPCSPPCGKAQQYGILRTPSHRAFLPDATSLLGTSTPAIIGVLSDMPCARFPNRGCRLRFDTCSGEEIRPLQEPRFSQRKRSTNNSELPRLIGLSGSISADTAVIFLETLQ